MSEHPPSPTSGSLPAPKTFLFVSLLVILGLMPPETRGEAQIGVSLLVAMAALLTWNEPVVARGRAFLVVALVLAVPLVRAACAPGTAIDPVAIGIVGCVAGLSAAACGFSRVSVAVLAVPAVSAGVVGIHAIHQKIRGLSALRAVVEADPLLPDRELILARIAEGRSFGAFPTPAALGGYLAMMLPVTVALALARRGRMGVLLWAAAVLQVAGLVFSASATASAALFAAAAAAVVLQGGRRKIAALAIVAVAIPAGLVVLRGTDILSISRPDGPWRLRAGNFRVAREMTLDHPFKGVGPGGYGEMFPAYAREGDSRTIHAHDLPLELTAELGLPFGVLLTVVFFSVFLAPLVRLRRSRGPPVRAGLAIGLAAFAIQNLADFTAFLPSLFWTACILRGIASRAGDTPEPVRSGGRLIPAIALSGTIVSTIVCGLSGAAWNARYDARLLVTSGRGDAAEAKARRGVRLAPWNVDGRILLAEIHLANGSAEPAAEQVAAAVRLSPVRPAARDVRARVRLAEGDPQGALADWSEAARLHPAEIDYRTRRDALAARVTELMPEASP